MNLAGAVIPVDSPVISLPYYGDFCFEQEKPGGIITEICYCLGDRCGWQRVATELGENSRMVPDDEQLYSLRDNFLAHSFKGQEYINDYNLLSGELDDLITLSDAMTIGSLVAEHSHKITYLTDRGYDSEILYGESVRAEIEQLINSLIGRYVGFGPAIFLFFF